MKIAAFKVGSDSTGMFETGLEARWRDNEQTTGRLRFGKPPRHRRGSAFRTSDNGFPGFILVAEIKGEQMRLKRSRARPVVASRINESRALIRSLHKQRSARQQQR